MPRLPTFSPLPGSIRGAAFGLSKQAGLEEAPVFLPPAKQASANVWQSYGQMVKQAMLKVHQRAADEWSRSPALQQQYPAGWQSYYAAANTQDRANISRNNNEAAFIVNQRAQEERRQIVANRPAEHPILQNMRTVDAMGRGQSINATSLQPWQRQMLAAGGGNLRYDSARTGAPVAPAAIGDWDARIARAGGLPKPVQPVIAQAPEPIVRPIPTVTPPRPVPQAVPVVNRNPYHPPTYRPPTPFKPPKAPTLV